MKFRYYIFYKEGEYVLFDRKTKHIHYRSFGFYNLYLYLKKHNYNFNDVFIKSMSLHSFFRDFAYFEEEKLVL